MDNETIINQIREGLIDINNSELFFSAVIMGFIKSMNNSINVRGSSVPHMIISTGDDTMYLKNKGQDMSVEPYIVSNEDYVINKIPRCVVNPAGIEIQADQVSSPYSRGIFQYSGNDTLIDISAEFRRMPVVMTCDLKYYVDSYTDMMELIQQLVTKKLFIGELYSIIYMGQMINCSYEFPQNFDGEANLEIDGTTTSSKFKTVSVSIDIETNIPIYDNKTAVAIDKIITGHKYEVSRLHNETR